jgi:hypothetical protein
MNTIKLEISKQEALWIFAGLDQNEQWVRKNMKNEPELAKDINKFKIKVRELILDNL